MLVNRRKIFNVLGFNPFMNLKLPVFFLLLLPLSLFLLLLSYQLTLVFYPFTPAQQQTVNFLQGKEELKANYTAAEISHLQDVQKVMGWVEVIFITLFLAVVVLIFNSLTFNPRTINSKTNWKNLVRWGGLVTVALVVLILLSLLLSFNTTFTLFHRLFFPQGNWLFPAESLLIQTFPLGFFVKITTIIFLLALALGSLFILLPSFFRHASRRPGN
jgi:integral membrane protein (TIGR01906 family)